MYTGIWLVLLNISYYNIHIIRSGTLRKIGIIRHIIPGETKLIILRNVEPGVLQCTRYIYISLRIIDCCSIQRSCKLCCNSTAQFVLFFHALLKLKVAL